MGVELLRVVDATTMPMQSRGRDGEKLGKSELVGPIKRGAYSSALTETVLVDRQIL